MGDDLRGGDIGQLSLGRAGRRVSGDESSQTGLSRVLSSVWLGGELALTVADNRLFHWRSFTDLMSPMGHNGTGERFQDDRCPSVRAPRCPNDCSTTGPLSPGSLLDISGVITPMPDGDNVWNLKAMLVAAHQGTITLHGEEDVVILPLLTCEEHG